MADRLDHLFQEWAKLGSAAIVARLDPRITARELPVLIADTTSYCRDSGRLTWVLLEWLIRHIDELDPGELITQVRQRGDLSVMGVVADAARAKRPHGHFDQIIAACTPHERREPFFHRVAGSPLASRLARENSNEIFRRWNYYSSELRYL